MTWFPKAGGYELFFNRDEQKTRKTATLPSKQRHDNGVEYIAPTDTDAGGTWIAMNQFGITACLLNHYQYEQIATYKDWVSRGEIVRGFAGVDSVDGLVRQFLSMNLEDYRAFRLFVIAPDCENRLCIWDGHEARVENNVTAPKSSSSVDAKRVKSMRKQYFADLGIAAKPSTEAFTDYHASHFPSKSKNSVCMHRDDANTVSFSHVDVDGEFASFRYADGAPCEATLSEPLSLPLNSNSTRLRPRVVAVKQ